MCVRRPTDVGIWVPLHNKNHFLHIFIYTNFPVLTEHLKLTKTITPRTYRILIFCWPCISIYLFLNINHLDALNFYNKFISSLYMFRAHVLIVRRAKIVLYSLRYRQTYRCDDTRDCTIKFLPSWRWAHVLETCRGLK